MYITEPGIFGAYGHRGLGETYGQLTPSYFGEAQAIPVIGLGIAAFTIGRTLFTSGDFSNTTNTVGGYQHPGTPLAQTFSKCSMEFSLKAWNPRPLPSALGGGWQTFWYQLSFEYNGNDLRNLTIVPLVDKSTKLYMSTFTTTWTGQAYSPVQAPVAEVMFQLSGKWDPWGRGVFTFDGELKVAADGKVSLSVKSERNWVRVDRGPTNCALVSPFVPKRNFFSLAILFPFGKDIVSEKDVRRLFEWVDGLPASTKEKIGRGEISVHIDGFASRPGGELYNLGLSERRANNVQNYLRKFMGSKTNFEVRSLGKFKQNLPPLFDVMQWVKRFLDPNKFDQAAVIWFEDVG